MCMWFLCSLGKCLTGWNTWFKSFFEPRTDTCLRRLRDALPRILPSWTMKSYYCLLDIFLGITSWSALAPWIRKKSDHGNPRVFEVTLLWSDVLEYGSKGHGIPRVNKNLWISEDPGVLGHRCQTPTKLPPGQVCLQLDQNGTNVKRKGRFFRVVEHCAWIQKNDRGQFGNKWTKMGTDALRMDCFWAVSGCRKKAARASVPPNGQI